MANLDDLKAADAAEDAKIDLLITGYNDLKALVKTLTEQLAAAATDSAKVQELVDAANAEAAKIDAALTATTTGGTTE